MGKVLFSQVCVSVHTQVGYHSLWSQVSSQLLVPWPFWWGTTAPGSFPVSGPRSFLEGVPQSQVLSLVSGPRTFAGGGGAGTWGTSWPGQYWGYPPHPGQDWGTSPPPPGTGLGYPPPPPGRTGVPSWPGLR